MKLAINSGGLGDYVTYSGCADRIMDPGGVLPQLAQAAGLSGLGCGCAGVGCAGAGLGLFDTGLDFRAGALPNGRLWRSGFMCWGRCGAIPGEWLAGPGAQAGAGKRKLKRSSVRGASWPKRKKAERMPRLRMKVSGVEYDKEQNRTYITVETPEFSKRYYVSGHVSKGKALGFVKDRVERDLGDVRGNPPGAFARCVKAVAKNAAAL